MGTRVTLTAKPDEARVIGKPSLLREIGEQMNLRAMTIVEPSLKREIRRKLAKTPQAHKRNPDGTARSPLGGLGAGEIGGSKTEKETRVRVVQTKASGAGAGRGGRGASYTIEATSLAQTHDKQLSTLSLMLGGRRSRGTLTKNMSFWGRRGDEGRVRVRPYTKGRRFYRTGVVPAVRYMGIPADPSFGSRVFNSRVQGQLSRALESVVAEVISKDGLRDWVSKWRIEVDIE